MSTGAATNIRSKRFRGNVVVKVGFLGSPRLLANPEFADDVAIAIGIVRLQVIQKAAALADQLQKTAPRGVVLLVRFEVLGQFADARTQNRDLNLRRAGVPSWVRKLSIRVVFFAVASTACVTPLVFSGPLFSV